jgi:hypothetical protein
MEKTHTMIHQKRLCQFAGDFSSIPGSGIKAGASGSKKATELPNQTSEVGTKCWSLIQAAKKKYM